MSYTGAAQGLGFLLGSSLGGLLAFCDFTVFGKPINANTAPGYFSVLIGIGNMICCYLYMRDFTPEKENTPSTSIQTSAPPAHLKPDMLAIVVSNVLFFLSISSFAVVLCTVTIYLDINYEWTSAAIAWVFAAGSLLGVITFKNIKALNKRFSEIKMMMFGFSLAGLALMIMGGFGQFDVSLGVWLVAIVFFFLAHPMAMACNLSLYAKIIGPFKGDQGPYMGYITMSGALASIASPLWSTALLGWEDYSGLVTFTASGGLMLLGTAGCLLYYDILVPHPMEKQAKALAAVDEDADDTPYQAIALDDK